MTVFVIFRARSANALAVVLMVGAFFAYWREERARRERGESAHEPTILASGWGGVVPWPRPHACILAPRPHHPTEGRVVRPQRVYGVSLFFVPFLFDCQGFAWVTRRRALRRAGSLASGWAERRPTSSQIARYGALVSGLRVGDTGASPVPRLRATARPRLRPHLSRF